METITNSDKTELEAAVAIEPVETVKIEEPRDVIRALEELENALDTGLERMMEVALMRRGLTEGILTSLSLTLKMVDTLDKMIDAMIHDKEEKEEGKALVGELRERIDGAITTFRHEVEEMEENAATLTGSKEAEREAEAEEETEHEHG